MRNEKRAAAGRGEAAAPEARQDRRASSKRLNRLTLAASLIVFAAALAVLYRNLEKVEFAELLARILAQPAPRLLAAVLFTAASYLVLTAYDYLALGYVRRRLAFREFGFASFVAFAFSHNIGLALVSGGAVRYRVYSALGLGAGEIAEVVVFCAVTYALGITTVGGLMLSFDPTDVAPVIGISVPLVRLAGAALLAAGVLYLGASALRRRPLVVGRFGFRLPSVGSGAAQVAIAGVDLALAGAVVFLLLPPDAAVTYRTFLGIYVLASAAAVLSHVPGGLGVFEAVIVVMLPDVPKAASMGALIVFRVIYFLLPLALATLSMALYEVRRGRRELARTSARRDQISSYEPRPRPAPPRRSG